MQPDHDTDFLIIGAGFSGLVVAERLSAAGWRCVVADRRSRIGGNAADAVDSAGVLVHLHGPHYFRTNSQRIIDYWSRFTEWHHVDYRILSHTRERYWSFPINLRTYEQMVGRDASEAEFSAWLDARREPVAQPENSEQMIVSQVGREWYEWFFKGYTWKQWRRDPSQLDASVCGRVPIRTHRDDRYLTESFQAMPALGYTAMFERLLAESPRVELQLGMDFHEARRKWRHRHLVFTGAVDEYFNRCHGALPYRSLRFEFESFDPDSLVSRRQISGKDGFWQPAVQVNYPDLEVPMTRIVEIKHVTGQQVASSTIVREFPKDWSVDDEPFYPVPAPDSREAYAKYASMAAAEPNTSFIGRLATYRYYNMDQVTGMALAEADRLLARHGRPGGNERNPGT